MAYNTLPIVLKDTKILLVGGGNVSLSKAKTLHNSSMAFSVVAEEFLHDFTPFGATLSQKKLSKDDLDGVKVVVDATGSQEVQTQLLTLQKEQNFLYSSVANPSVSDFFFSALVEREGLKVAISSSGASPTLTKVVKEKIEKFLPLELAELNNTLFNQRQEGIINKTDAKEQTQKLFAKVVLVGCGTGDVELLTIKAYKAIQRADVVFVDHLVSDEIVALVPKDTKQIFVGKQKGAHSMKQEEINTLLIEYAKKGFEVARLKAGDPYIFGRGAEEALALLEEGIKVEVIAGISSALAGPLSAGIAPTARGYATNLSIVSAHLAGNLLNTEWIEMLHLKNHTTIVLMGLSRAKEIVEVAKEIGVDMNLPTAIISNASRENQTVTITTLKELPLKAVDAPRPAIIVFGDVVKLHSMLPSK